MKKLNIVIPDAKTISCGDVSFDCFKEFGEVTEYQLSGERFLAERIKNADIILCNKTPMNEKTIGEAKNLQYIGLFATGYNNIDTEYAKKRGITVCNAAGYSTDAVAQHTFAFILAQCSKVAEYNEFVQADGWKKSDIFSPFVFPTNEIAGKTLGIVGLGTIGKAVAQIALAFRMNVIYYSRTEKNMPGVRRVSLDELVSESDFVTVHCPLNADSELMFNESLFAKFKKGSYFINTSRGGTVDEKALANAVKSGIISGAAVDVVTTEPMAEDCPLCGVENITITPHVAWAATETRERCVQVAYNNLKMYLQGNPINKVV